MKHILIVDDSKLICRTLEKLIIERLRFIPVIAHSKKECEEKLLEHNCQIDVALVCLSLPDSMDGEAVDYVSKIGIPTVVLTGSAEKEDIFRGKNIVDYVIKEGAFSFEYILSLVNRIIQNQGVKVLIVEDSKVAGFQVMELLKRYELTCFYAKDGIEALDILKQNPDIKMVFTDYNMPNMDGLELTKEIRKKYSKDELCIVTVTGSKDSKTVARFLKYGANDFLYKGFLPEEFYARLNSNLETIDLFKQMKDKVNRDYMTGMFNRRYFFDRGGDLYKKAKKDKSSIGVAVFDIDKFKSINDTYGHDIGDIAIKEVANVVDKHFDGDAIVARFGGEEFCVVKAELFEDEFLEILEAIRIEFENNIIDTPKGDIQYTVSIGYCMEYGESLEDMVNNADEGLYIAKHEGRNQVRKKK